MHMKLYCPTPFGRPCPLGAFLGCPISGTSSSVPCPTRLSFCFKAKETWADSTDGICPKDPEDLQKGNLHFNKQRHVSHPDPSETTCHLPGHLVGSAWQTFIWGSFFVKVARLLLEFAALGWISQALGMRSGPFGWLLDLSFSSCILFCRLYIKLLGLLVLQCLDPGWRCPPAHRFCWKHRHSNPLNSPVEHEPNTFTWEINKNGRSLHLWTSGNIICSESSHDSSSLRSSQN